MPNAPSITCPSSKPACARLPQTGLLRPEGHQGAVSIAHVLQIVALTMQAHAGCPVTFGRTASTIEPGVFQVVVEYSEEEVGRLAMELAQVLVRAALDDTPFDLADASSACATWTKTCVWDPAPAPSSTPPRPATSPIAA